MQWMLPTLLQLLPAALWGIGTFVCPESPRWLLSVNGREEAGTLSRNCAICLSRTLPWPVNSTSWTRSCFMSMILWVWPLHDSFPKRRWFLLKVGDISCSSSRPCCSLSGLERMRSRSTPSHLWLSGNCWRRCNRSGDGHLWGRRACQHPVVSRGDCKFCRSATVAFGRNQPTDPDLAFVGAYLKSDQGYDHRQNQGVARSGGSPNGGHCGDLPTRRCLDH